MSMTMAPSILVVDDEPDIRESLQFLLERDIPGAHVEVAASAEDALAYLRRNKVHLILTDYKMPGMDGLEFAHEVRRNWSTIPIIMMTAYPDTTLAARALTEFGIGLMVAKPFDLDYLVGVVRTVTTPPLPPPSPAEKTPLRPFRPAP